MKEGGKRKRNMSKGTKKHLQHLAINELKHWKRAHATMGIGVTNWCSAGVKQGLM